MGCSKFLFFITIVNTYTIKIIMKLSYIEKQIPRIPLTISSMLMFAFTRHDSILKVCFSIPGALFVIVNRRLVWFSSTKSAIHFLIFYSSVTYSAFLTILQQSCGVISSTPTDLTDRCRSIHPIPLSKCKSISALARNLSVAYWRLSTSISMDR
jgi:hypothetical protein